MMILGIVSTIVILTLFVGACSACIISGRISQEERQMKGDK